MSALLETIAADPLLALLLQLAVTATAVAAAVLGAAGALRRATAPVRAAWLLAGVVTLLLLPAATVLARATPFGLPLITATAPAAEQELEVQTKVGIGALLQAPIEARSPVEPGAASVPPSATPGPDAARADAVSPRVAGAWFAIAWLAAAAVEALLQLRAAFAAARLRRRSFPVTDAAAIAEVAALARELGMRAPPLRCSSELPCPATFGAWRPVVVLPQRLLAAPAAARAAVLRHELVHVALRHPQQALLLALLRVLFAWHPLVRRVAARLAHLHEELADNGALAGGVEPLAYARTLLSFAAASRGLLRAPQALFAVGVGLTRRIERLTASEPETMTTTTTRIRAAAAAAATILALLPYAVRVLPAQEPAAAGAQTKGAAPDPRDAATYMPRTRGTRWTWRSTWTGDDGKPYEAVHSAVVFGEVPIGDTSTTCTQLVFAGNENPEYWSAGADGLRQHDNAYIGERGVAATGSARWLAAPVGAESRWEWDSQMACQIEGSAAMPDPETLRVHHAAELIAFDEAVTVPAGTFRCAHVRVTETNRDWEKPHTIELWFGRGTGIVKRIDSQIGKRELIAFAPGEAVPDRDVALQQALAREGAEHVMRRVEWLAPGEWSCHVQGDFAVVWLGEGGKARCFHVDRAATAFALDDVAFWSARFADDASEFRWAGGQPNGRGGVEVTLHVRERNSSSWLQYGLVAARLAAMRTFALPTSTKWSDEQSQTVGARSATAEVRSTATAPDGTARWGSCKFEFADGALKVCAIGTSPLQPPKGG